MDEPVDGRTVQRELAVAFGYSYFHDDWVNPLADALAGVTVEEAAWQPTSDTCSIWQIVLHVTTWADNILERMAERMQGDPLGRPPEDWPSMPDTLDEVSWQKAQAHLWKALTGIRAQIENVPMADMLDYGSAGYSQFEDLLCRFIHNAYHIGQITTLRAWWASRGTAV